MSNMDMLLKRMFDLAFSLMGLLVFFPIIGITWLVAAVETRSNGFFVQQRIGRNGSVIRVCKIKTMFAGDDERSPIASNNLGSITRSGKFFRQYKLDELPQLFNVFAGHMSFVGPRPDVPGYADRLEGRDRIILRLRPGITGPASIKYRDEESLLAAVDDPASYNDKIIWPDKVKINREYLEKYSLLLDVGYILQTIFR